METGLSKQFEKKFGKSWLCSCGSPFQTGWLESITVRKDGAAARYFCQLCGREQTFFVSFREKVKGLSSPEVPRSRLTSDDVLDIKEELAQARMRQIKGLAKKVEQAKVTLPKIDRHEGI